MTIGEITKHKHYGDIIDEDTCTCCRRGYFTFAPNDPGHYCCMVAMPVCDRCQELGVDELCDEDDDDIVKEVRHQISVSPSKEVVFKVLRDIYWDAGHEYVKVYSEGEAVNGEVCSDGIVAYCPTYGVSDYIDSEDIQIF